MASEVGYDATGGQEAYARRRRTVRGFVHGDARDHRGGTAGDVWPWLVQIGFGRAGWYSYDWLDHRGKPSADRVIPELQTIAVGDRIPMSGRVDERTAFRVATFEPKKSLCWTKPDSTWSWALDPIDERHTRVVSRLRCRHDPTTPRGLAGVLLMEIGDFPMFRKLLLNLRRRSEALATARRRGDQPGTGGEA